MGSFWKVFVALALVLPLGAFVAGNLVAAAEDDPAPRDTIIIDQQGGTPSGEASTSPSADTTPGSGATPRGNEHGDDGLVTEVTPPPDEWDDDHGDHGGGHGDDDSSGHDSGHDSSGHGGSGSSGGGDDGHGGDD
ncbi:hypothetical protein [Nocardioides halotolerans]|jgi:hypothetical protein|uniref:hypothetical protein n=1 Tax=Nocardioides halotolerans TaxID=433660 RepID=UPI00041C3C3D|nr:hypothetical protein [Nocardioides halotolerans]